MRTFPDALTFCLSAATSALAGRRYVSCLWELTYRCTSRCGMCNYWRQDGREEDELTLPQIERGLERVFAYGCRLVNFTGGEPTLRDDLEQIVSRASALGMWTSVVTNGSLLTRERVGGLRKAGLDNLLVSLDAATSEAHDDQRGTAGSFRRVDECTRWIREEFLRGHRTGGVMCVISRRNCAQLDQLIGFARERGVFILFQPYHANKTGDASLVPDLGEPQIRQLLSSNHPSRVVLNSRSYLQAMYRSREPASRFPCRAGHKYLSVDPFGRLHPCVDMPAVGHVLTDEITVVKSPTAREMVSACRGCWYCFRGEADTSLSLAGCVEKLGLAASVLRHNAALRFTPARTMRQGRPQAAGQATQSRTVKPPGGKMGPGR